MTLNKDAVWAIFKAQLAKIEAGRIEAANAAAIRDSQVAADKRDAQIAPPPKPKPGK